MRWLDLFVHQFFTLSGFAAICWSLVGLIALVAVLHRSVRDTLIERIALSMISMGSFSQAFSTLQEGRTDTHEAWTAVSLAAYCLILWCKHLNALSNLRRAKYEPKDDTGLNHRY